MFSGPVPGASRRARTACTAHGPTRWRRREWPQERVRRGDWSGRSARGTRRRRCTGCAASSTRRSVVPARRGGRATRRSPAWRCCDSRRASAGSHDALVHRGGRARPIRRPRRQLLAAVVEIELAAGDAEAAATRGRRADRANALVDAMPIAAGLAARVRRGGAHSRRAIRGGARAELRAAWRAAGARHAVRGGPVPRAHGAGVAALGDEDIGFDGPRGGAGRVRSSSGPCPTCSRSTRCRAERRRRRTRHR